MIELYAEMYEKKDSSTRNSIILNLIKFFVSKIKNKILKQITELCINFELVSYELT